MYLLCCEYIGWLKKKEEKKRKKVEAWGNGWVITIFWQPEREILALSGLWLEVQVLYRLYCSRELVGSCGW
jgi:hypothetical protein